MRTKASTIQSKMTTMAWTSKKKGNWAVKRARTLKEISQKTESFRSKFEAKLAQQLKDAGLPVQYETEKLSYHTSHTYTPDFKLPNGILLEVKGYWLPADRSKHLKIRKENPEADIRFVLQTPSRVLSKTSKTTYAQWCDKHNFQWSSKVIPTAWLNE
jgi:hypothetical protein